jgi:hypothetical protein
MPKRQVLPQITGLLLLYLSATIILKFYYKSIFEITENSFSCFCFFYKIFGGKRFQKLNG